MTDTTHTETPTQEVDVEETQAVSEDTVADQGVAQEETPTNPTTTANDDASTESQEGDDDADDDDAMVPLSKLKKVRNEAKNLRDRLKVAEDRVVELESREGDAALVQERDELKAQVQSLQSAAKTATLTNHVTKAAQDENALQPEVIVRLLNESDVRWENDIPTNVKDLVASLKKTYPKLFATSNGNVGARNERTSESTHLTGEDRIRHAMTNRG